MKLKRNNFLWKRKKSYFLNLIFILIFFTNKIIRRKIEIKNLADKEKFKKELIPLEDKKVTGKDKLTFQFLKP